MYTFFFGTTAHAEIWPSSNFASYDPNLLRTLANFSSPEESSHAEQSNLVLGLPSRQGFYLYNLENIENPATDLSLIHI